MLFGPHGFILISGQLYHPDIFISLPKSDFKVEMKNMLIIEEIRTNFSNNLTMNELKQIINVCIL